ncbi:putative dsRNA-binding protein [Vibrio sp. PID23_8]|uniref:putative dsRNA-binding protein n=1 Tax=Vibrio sp. PID23_8 TaxID=1583767 RepID=UPI000E69C848|nr:putative dsRNA-binding protein [Vibrio sp. PID23_8]
MKIQLSKVCFGLPMKSFFIDYTVSKKRELPVVKEFVIRLIYSLTSTSLETIQDYFGFTSKEMLAIVDDLQEENLIEWESGKVKLTYYAMSKFTEEDGNLRPTFFEVTDEASPVEFELYSFRMLSTDVRRSGSQDFSVSLNLPDDCYRNLLSKAQNAFDTNFTLFRELVLKEDVFSEIKDLYKINQVSDRFDSTLPLEIEYFVDTESPNILKMEYVSKTVDEWDEDKSMFSLMDSTIQVDMAKDLQESFSEYLEASNDPLLVQYWDDDARTLNLKAVANHYENGLTKLSDNTFMLLGNFYTERNRDILTNRLKGIFAEKPDNSGLIWLTNAESKTWGKTTDLSKLVDEVYGFFDKRKKTSKVILGMTCQSYQESMTLRNNFWKLSDALLMDLPARFGGENAEFMIIPGLMVASLFHAQLDDQRDISFPVGYVSFEPKLISEVSKKLLDWTTQQPKYYDFFEKRDVEEEKKVRNKHFMPILQQNFNREVNDLFNDKVDVELNQSSSFGVNEQSRTSKAHTLGAKAVDTYKPSEFADKNGQMTLSEHGDIGESSLQKLIGSNKPSKLWDIAFYHYSHPDASKMQLDLLSNAGKQSLELIAVHLIQNTVGLASSGHVGVVKKALITGVREKLLELGLIDKIRKGSGITDAESEKIEHQVVMQLLGTSWVMNQIGWLYKLAQTLDIRLDSSNEKPMKMVLQEYAQSKKLQAPQYDVVEITGPQHNQVFSVQCSIENKKAVGSGNSKKKASEDAAIKLFQNLNKAKSTSHSSSVQRIYIRPKDIHKWTKCNNFRVQKEVAQLFGIPPEIKSGVAFVPARLWKEYATSDGGNKTLAQLGINLQQAIISRELIRKCLENDDWSIAQRHAGVSRELVSDDFYNELDWLNTMIWREPFSRRIPSKEQVLYINSVIRALYGLSYLCLFEENFCAPDIDKVMRYRPFKQISESLNKDKYINKSGKDSKTQLQEVAQDLKVPLPIYETTQAEGEEHNQIFEVKCSFNGQLTFGEGTSFKGASQQAAMAMLQKVESKE